MDERMNGLNEGIQSNDGMTLTEKQIIYTRRKPVLIATPSNTYPTKTALWSNPDVRGDQTTFTRLKQGTARNGTVSSRTKTVFGEWLSEMHAAVGRKNIWTSQNFIWKYLLVSAQNAQTSSANCTEVSKFLPLFLTFPFVLNYKYCMLIFFFTLGYMQVEFRSPGGQITHFPFP